MDKVSEELVDDIKLALGRFERHWERLCSAKNWLYECIRCEAGERECLYELRKEKRGARCLELKAVCNRDIGKIVPLLLKHSDFINMLYMINERESLMMMLNSVSRIDVAKKTLRDLTCEVEVPDDCLYDVEEALDDVFLLPDDYLVELFRLLFCEMGMRKKRIVKAG